MSEHVSAEKQIAALGIVLPPAPDPLGAYTETIQSGRLLFITGTLPVLSGRLQHSGVLGRDVDLDQGRAASRLAALNALAAARQHLGSLDLVTRVVKTEVYLVATDEYVMQLPKIADGASEFLLEVFGNRGLSTRKIMGVAKVPLNAPVMVELLLEVDGQETKL